MELSQDSFQVFEKYPGIYLFLVHPNEVVSSFFFLLLNHGFVHPVNTEGIECSYMTLENVVHLSVNKT